ncbi:MAG: peptidase inhibitor family I36 protein [Thermodesulfovibrionales bacterium]|nr:peptidase inhibitor family I36 protein [Thermodesulfovibrionales bacterium]
MGLMKKNTNLLMLIVSILLISSLAFAQTPREDEVIFYEHANYGGAWMGAKAGADYSSLMGTSITPTQQTINWNDAISSIKVGTKVFVKVYEHVNYGGASKIFTSDNSNLHNVGWGDKISSFKIRYKSESCDPDTRDAKDDEVIFFEHVNYGGAWMGAKIGSEYPSIGGTATMGTGQTINWNDAISSIKVGKKVRITVYEHDNYRGQSYTWQASCNAPLCLDDLRNSGWNDKISSFKVTRNPACP